MARIAALYRYPIKGLSAEPLAAVELRAGDWLPLDRRYALARPNVSFDPAAPRWLPKANFLMLMRDARLALLRASYRDGTKHLRLRRDGTTVLEADLATAEGRAAVEAFFETFMGLDGRPRLVEAPGHAFTDSARRTISLINLATLRELEERLGAPVHPLRFRANLYVEDLPPWAEFEWLGRELRVGDGGVCLQAASRIDRCAATCVDPDTAARDVNVPLALRRQFGHIDCGIYLRVVVGGRIARGQSMGISIAADG